MGTSSGLRLVPGDRPTDKYRLLTQLGEGGMANVYLSVARGPARFSKLLVVKAIKPELALDADLLAMFLDEARLTARLSHPNVVQTLEISEISGRPAIVMEYLEGQSLASVLWKPEGQGMTLAMKLRILAAALEGLQYIHDLTDFDGTPLELVHRDVSPHNVFVTYDGQVKVLDFGIAKGLFSQGSTRTDVLKGKIRYMAPEQMNGEGLDRRADVFSAGVVLWEILTGTRIWQGRSEVNVMNAVLRDGVPAPKAIAPSVPPALNDICVKALARAPSDRYATAGELLAAIEDAARDLGPPVMLKEIGALLGEAFASSRAQIHALIDAELKAHDGEASHERLIVPPRVIALSNELFNDPTMTAPGEIAPAKAASPRRKWAAVAIALGIGALMGASIAVRHAAGPAHGTEASALAAPAAIAQAPSAPNAAVAPAAAVAPTEASAVASVAAPAPPPPATAAPARRKISANPVASARRTGQAALAPHSIDEAKPAAPLVTVSEGQPDTDSHCSPPFYFDDQGIKRLKVNCF